MFESDGLDDEGAYSLLEMVCLLGNMRLYRGGFRLNMVSLIRFQPVALTSLNTLSTLLFPLSHSYHSLRRSASFLILIPLLLYQITFSSNDC